MMIHAATNDVQEMICHEHGRTRFVPEPMHLLNAIS